MPYQVDLANIPALVLAWAISTSGAQQEREDGGGGPGMAALNLLAIILSPNEYALKLLLPITM